MDEVQIAVAVAAAVVLFLFGIEHFSAEIQTITGRRFRNFIAKGTNNRFAGFTLGAAVTAVIQSSTATSVIAVGLVNAGVLTFRQTLGVLFGANVGTTVTAQLVALKLTDFAPALILFGFVVSLLPFKWKIFGRSIFYFGIVFFSLDLVSSAVEPLKSDPRLLEALASLDNAALGILVGALFTALVQSSSVTTGVAIVLMSQGTLPLEAAIPLILGANIGTTSTTLMAAAQLDTSAKRTAVSHALYNVLGVLIFLPFLGIFERTLTGSGLSGGPALAVAHLIFNLTTACLFLAFLEPFARLVERLVPDDIDADAPLPALTKAVFLQDEAGDAAVNAWAGEVMLAQRRGYVTSVLAIETRDGSIDARARRSAALVEYALEEASLLVRESSDGELSVASSESILRFVVIIDHLRQVQDSLGDLQQIGERLDRQNGRLSIDSLLEIQAVFPVYAKIMFMLAEALQGEEGRYDAVVEVQEQARARVQEAYRSFLVLVRKTDESAELADFLSIHQRLRTKLAAFASFLESDTAVPPPADGPPRLAVPRSGL